MLSRVADSIYWMSRYLERAENIARYISVNLQLLCDQPAVDEQWEPFIVASGDHEPFFEKYEKATTRGNVLMYLTFDDDNPNSILNCLRKARENARSVREVISSEMWEQINIFYYHVLNAAQRGWQAFDPQEFYTHVKDAHHLFKGVTDASMSHGEAWHFARLGQLLERADKTSRILDLKYYILLPDLDDVGTTVDAVQWAALLKSASALEMYRKRHHVIEPALVSAFLLLDREFPRAVRYCLVKAAESLHAISGTSNGSFANSAEQRLGKLRTEFDYMQVDEILMRGLHEFLDQLQDRLNLVGEAIASTFFCPSPAARPSRLLALAG
jgi:uncharacterized alpha-E superfamily protein